MANESTYNSGLSFGQKGASFSQPNWVQLMERIQRDAKDKAMGIGEYNKTRPGGTLGQYEQRTEHGGDRISRMFQEFITRMQAPLDMNDPQVKMIVQNAASAGSTAARNRGIEGGLAVANTEAHVANAQSALKGQREQLGLQAIGALSNRDMGQQQRADALKMYQDQAARLQAQQEYERSQAQGQGLGSLIGGGLGALGGIALAPLTGGMSIPFGISLGTSLGGGVGGLASGASYQPSPYKPSWSKNYSGGY